MWTPHVSDWYNGDYLFVFGLARYYVVTFGMIPVFQLWISANTGIIPISASDGYIYLDVCGDGKAPSGDLLDWSGIDYFWSEIFKK